MFDGRFRAPVERAVKPLGDGLRRTGLSPDHLTLLGLLLGVAAAIAIGMGALRAGLLLVVLAARGAATTVVAPAEHEEFQT